MAGGGGAWKVAYADFVTAMMAFFMVMWLVAQNKPAREAVSKYFADPNGKSDRPAGNLRRQPHKELHPGGTKMLKKGTEGVGITQAQPQENEDQHKAKNDATSRVYPIIRNFDPRSSVGIIVGFGEFSVKLDEKNEHLLSTFLPTLLGKTNKIEVRGHASPRPIPPDSPYKNAWDLSYARSQEIMNYLVQNGVEQNRIRLYQAAANEPLNKRTQGASLENSARAEIYLLNEFIEDAAELKKPHKNEMTTDETKVTEKVATETAHEHKHPQ